MRVRVGIRNVSKFCVAPGCFGLSLFCLAGYGVYWWGGRVPIFKRSDDQEEKWHSSSSTKEGKVKIIKIIYFDTFSWSSCHNNILEEVLNFTCMHESGSVFVYFRYYYETIFLLSPLSLLSDILLSPSSLHSEPSEPGWPSPLASIRTSSVGPKSLIVTAMAAVRSLSVHSWRHVTVRPSTVRLAPRRHLDAPGTPSRRSFIYRISHWR